ncbi:RND family efflux transporter, MFP subunit [Cnuella takakiae]|uniref:RND family efflux transporter, MFP subunit n=1 Tax=Cnuella takakiae TaxID=1302690 RepID=A0A1M5IJ57_9BACT|nr:efflux RND transporter periplasmic adaptor subunit [Cnuella takakiae]OLY92206.1 hypothetical protein BUE76_10100 [Cnuella takakiae]SHG28404.1 RND family efflux transporter, MFP subunit [Cnuella takakiae]
MKPIIFAAFILIVLQSCGGKATTQTAVVKDESIPVKLFPLSSDTRQAQVAASGLLSTEETAGLGFKIGGIIESVLVTEGQMVRKGQLLATLKPTEISAQVQQVALSVEKARRDYQRAHNLYQDSVATLEQLQNAQTGLDLAQQQYRQVAFNRQYANIYAPSDGFVVKQLGHAGEQVSAGTQVIAMNAVSGASRWVLKVGLTDKQWALVNKGDKATVQFDAFPGKTFTAIVTQKALAANPINGSFEVELQPDFKGVQPGAGIFGKAVILTSGTQELVPIPYESLLEAEGKEGFVFVSNDGKTVQRVGVQIAAIEPDRVFVNAGLEGHRYIVTSGSPYLTDGSRIKVIR